MNQQLKFDVLSPETLCCPAHSVDVPDFTILSGQNGLLVHPNVLIIASFGL